MSSPSHSQSCALRADGTLKDAHEIEFFNDPDDDKPLPSSSARSTSLAGTLDNFITAKASGLRAKPATVVGGARRSNRASRPSEKVRDSAPSPSMTVPAKRPRGSSIAEAPVQKQARVEDDGDDEDMPELCEDSDEEDEEDDEDEDNEENERMRLMGESDRKVSVRISV